jgi:hypothetical protein
MEGILEKLIDLSAEGASAAARISQAKGQSYSFRQKRGTAVRRSFALT